MKQKTMRSWFAGIAVLAILISCVLTGLVLPVAAATTIKSTSLETTTLWLMTGRYREMSGIVTYSDDTKASYTDTMTWSIADTSVAKVDTSGKVTPVKVGDTTLTGTFPAEVTSQLTGTIPSSITIDVHVIDGSDYVYSDIEYTYGENLVPNGDFEDGNTGWVPTSSTDFVEGCGKDNSVGHRMASGTNHHTGALTLQPACTYEFSFEYKAAPGTAFQIYGYNMKLGTLDFVQDSNADNAWHTYTKVFTTPSVQTGSYVLYVNQTTVNSEAPAVIDNVKIRECVSAVEIEQLAVNDSELLLQKNESHTLTLWTVPYGGNLNGVIWASSDDSVATVENGIVTAVGAGTAQITATTADGKHRAHCTVSVVGFDSAELLVNTSFDDTASEVWKTPYGVVTQYVASAGQYGTPVLRVDRNYPVYQTVTGLQPGTTYTIKGSAKLAVANSRLVITVTNGDEVLAVLNEQYAGEQWDTVSDGAGGTAASVFSAGYVFTTPNTLASDTTVFHMAVLKAADDTAETVAVIAESEAVSGYAVERGEGEVTDNEDSVEDSGVYYAYVDTARLYGTVTENVDLTPTDVQWSGDADNDGQVTPGTEITFKVPVKNVGTADLPVGEAFTVDVAANGKVIRTLTYNGGIAAGETVTVTDTAAWTAEKGDFMISAHVNASLSIPETNTKTNQTYQLNLRVADDEYTPAYNADVIAQAGMDRLTMSDDFDDLSTVDTLASGAEGYKWYVTRPWSAPTLTPNDYMVNDGILTLMSEVPTYNLVFNSVDMNTNNGFRYHQGYLEVRLRIVRPSPNDGHEEGVPTVWSHTVEKAMENITGTDTHWVELDWLEYWGTISQYPGGHYTTTFHQTTTVETDPAYSSSNHNLEGLGDAEWHVMGWLWEENSIRTFLDGVEMMNTFFDDESSLVPDPRTNNAYSSKTDTGVFSWINEEAAVLYLGGSKDNPMEIDYVRIWQASEPETVSDTMTLDKTEITMSEDTRERLTVSVPEGEDAGTLTWESSDPTVATVHGNGEVYARAAGATVITATNANGVSVMCTVTVRHNLISNGDFEFEENEDLLYGHWRKITAHSDYAIVAEPGNTDNHCLQAAKNAPATFYYDLRVEKGETYRLTGRVSSAAGVRDSLGIYLQSPYVVDDDKGTHFVYTADDGGWADFTLEFTTSSSTLNDNYVVAFRHDNGSPQGAVYVDDLVMTKVENVAQDSYTLTVGAMTNGAVSLIDDTTDTVIKSGESIAPGTIVEVTVEPDKDYQLSLGSLEYTYVQPTISGDKTVTREVLNKNEYDYTDEERFGAGEGNTFYFVMPSENVTLNALFEQTATATDSIAATLGTSVHVTNDTDISGVRFLNRLYYARMDADTGKLYVMYDGEEQEVTQFGTLLKRATNDGELTLAAYDEHKSDGSTTRIWKSEAMRNGNLYLADYTSGYVDFSITMTSSVANRYAFLDRGYTVCGYVVLANGTTVYTEAFTDSVLDARTRSL